MSRLKIYSCCMVLFSVMTGCIVEPPLDTPSSSDALLQLSFEERMAIRAEMTQMDSDAKADAAKVHDRFASHEAAIQYEQLVDELQSQKREALMNEHGLTRDDLDFIVDEYLQSQGVGLAE